MPSLRWRWLLTLTLRLLITLGFAVAIVSKVSQRTQWADHFVRWGYPAWGADATSVIEIVGVIALWVPALAKAGTAILMVVLIGAAGTWLIHGPRLAAIVPGTLLVMLACLAWFESAVKRASR